MAHDEIKRLKWLGLTEYVFLVDSAVELQNSYYKTSAKSGSPMRSPKSSMLRSRPEWSVNFISTCNLKSRQNGYQEGSHNGFITLKTLHTEHMAQRNVKLLAIVSVLFIVPQ